MNKNSTIRIKGYWDRNDNGKGYTWHTHTDSTGKPIPYNSKYDPKSVLPEYSHPNQPINKDK